MSPSDVAHRRLCKHIGDCLLRTSEPKVMHTLTQNYATLVSGVLIGLSEALEHRKPKTKH